MTRQTPEPFARHNGLAVYRFGRGEPVLLMPGPHRYQRPGERSADSLIGGLMALGRQVITFDPPESGQSTRTADIGMPEMLQCAGEALDVCHITSQIDLMGHSMGGLVTLAYALEVPARIKRLVLVGTGAGGTAYMDAPGALWNRTHPAFWRTVFFGLLFSLWSCRASEKMMTNFIERHSFYDQSHVRSEEVSWADWRQPARGRGSQWHRVARKLDYSGRLPEIVAPTLILCGRHDPQFPPATSRALAQRIPRAEVVFFARSGHYPFFEESDRFWRLVDQFWCGKKGPGVGKG